MKDCRQFYIDGKWTSPTEAHDFQVINPAKEEPIATISLGGAADIDKAVAAAKRAFESYSETTLDVRLAFLQRIIEVYQSKIGQMAETISLEMGAPLSLSQAAQAPAGLRHLTEIVKVLGHFKFEEIKGSTLMGKEPIGVCGLITPWNWPMNQIVCKVAPALASGCTMVLKPSEIAPLSAYLFAQILHEAGLPPGVFNIVNGDGPVVGSAIASHPDVAMVSFTGSTSRPTSSWRMLTLKMPSQRACRGASAIPASLVMRLLACSFRSPGWLTRLWQQNGQPRPPKLAIHSQKILRSARSQVRPSSKRHSS
jgi:aldehyde dehydrogenase (NAD+)